MADHLHKQIRTAAAATLTGLVTTAARVYANRLHPMEDTSLPGLRVSTDSDDVLPVTVHAPSVQQHRLTLAVECCARATTGLDDLCDQIQKEVEIALSAGFLIGTRRLFPVLTGSQYDDEAAGTPAAVKRVEFFIEYHTLNTQPDVLS